MLILFSYPLKKRVVKERKEIAIQTKFISFYFVSYGNGVGYLKN